MESSAVTRAPVSENELTDARIRFAEEYLRLRPFFGGHDWTVEFISPRQSQNHLGRFCLEPLGSLLVKIGERLRAFRTHT